MPEDCDEAAFPNSIPSVVAAIRAVLSTHPYRDTREDAGHMTFETTIEIPWSLVNMLLRGRFLTLLRGAFALYGRGVGGSYLRKHPA